MTDLVLTGARLLTPLEEVDDAWVAVRDGRIADVGTGAPPTGEVVDLAGCFLAPGFIDLHVHGGGGAHFMSGSAESCRQAARFHAGHGTTALLATTLSAPHERLGKAVAGIAAAMRDEPLIVGCHLEGPWLNSKRRGAQEAAHLRAPSRAELQALIRASAETVRLVSLAPELPPALGVIKAIVAAGAVAAIAHTDATYGQTGEAVAAGARHAVHVFNAMRPLHHREPGVIGAVLDDRSVTCELVADGHHVHPAVARLMYRAKGPDRLVLVTDAMEAAGLTDGDYVLGETPITVRDGVALTPEGSLAGSTLTMDSAVANFARWLGGSPARAVALATAVPADVIGLGARKGRITRGHDADMVVLDEQLRVRATLSLGRWVGASPGVRD